jgi:hypothetical protein
MRLINGKVVPKRKHPRNTGCLKDLYRTNGVPEAISQDLEVNFMAPLDTKAAAALRKLLAGIALDLGERAAWARFLLSMLYRNRECVEFIKAHMAELWREATAALEEDWAKRRKPGEHRTRRSGGTAPAGRGRNQRCEHPRRHHRQSPRSARYHLDELDPY